MTVLRRGLAGGEAVPTSPTARVVVTMSFDVLAQQLSGQGTTLVGDALSPPGRAATCL